MSQKAIRNLLKPLSALFLLAVSAVLVQPLFAQQDPTPVVHVDNPPNAATQQARHYVILVSLDGFRYDYPTKYGAPHIQSMATAGATAPEGMLPSYPSLTFPNHLTLATGLYPEHHGIVANSFNDPARTAAQGQAYVYTQPKTNSDGSWYGGTPLWVLAEQQGMRSACLFWPGSEAAIQGVRPSYYLHYDDHLDDRTRVDQVIAWLKLPPGQRPHFITLYYSNVDHAGHAYGPESDEVRAAVHHVDDMIGDLQTKLANLNLPVDLIVVADHGMVTLKGDPINLGEFAHLDGVPTEGSLLYPATEAEAARLYAEFKAHPDPRFSVYRRADVPEHLHFSTNPREGDPVLVPNGPYTLTTRPANPNNMGRGGATHGGHGFDPSTMPEMKAIFFAQGPDIKPNTQLPTFENINLYPFIARLLELRAPTVDGNPKVLEPALANPGPIIVKLSSNNGRGPSTLEPASDDEPVKIGLGVTPSAWLQKAEPQYTDKARKAHVNGSVLLSVRVEKDGHPSNIHVLRSLDKGLDENAVEAVGHSTFRPAMKDGKPVVVELQIEMNFQTY
jgi:TonB family protein